MMTIRNQLILPLVCGIILYLALSSAQGSIDMAKCSIPDCDKETYARTWCITHYQYWRRTGAPAKDADPVPKDAPAPIKKCAVTNCGRDVQAKGLCNKHYQKLRSSPAWTPNQATPKSDPTEHMCQVMACSLKTYSGGYCKYHYNKKVRGLPIMTPQEEHYQLCQSDIRTADVENPRWQKMYNPEAWAELGFLLEDEIPLTLNDVPEERSSPTPDPELVLNSEASPRTQAQTQTQNSDDNECDDFDQESSSTPKPAPLIDGWSLEGPDHEPEPLWQPDLNEDTNGVTE